MRFSELGLCNSCCRLVIRDFYGLVVLSAVSSLCADMGKPTDPASDCASLCSRLHHSSAQSQLDQEDALHAANRPIWTAGCSHDGGDHVSALMADRTPKLSHPPCSRLHHNSAQSQLDQEDARQPANRPMWTAGCAHDGSDHISALIADRTQKMTHPTHPAQKLTQRAFQERFQQRSLSHWTPSHQTN